MGGGIHLDDDEALALYAALDAPLYVDDPEFVADLQDEAHAMLKDILGLD